MGYWSILTDEEGYHCILSAYSLTDTVASTTERTHAMTYSTDLTLNSCNQTYEYDGDCRATKQTCLLSESLCQTECDKRFSSLKTPKHSRSHSTIITESMDQSETEDKEKKKRTRIEKEQQHHNMILRKSDYKKDSSAIQADSFTVLKYVDRQQKGVCPFCKAKLKNKYRKHLKVCPIVKINKPSTSELNCASSEMQGKVPKDGEFCSCPLCGSVISYNNVSHVKCYHVKTYLAASACLKPGVKHVTIKKFFPAMQKEEKQKGRVLTDEEGYHCILAANALTDTVASAPERSHAATYSTGLIPTFCNQTVESECITSKQACLMPESFKCDKRLTTAKYSELYNIVNESMDQSDIEACLSENTSVNSTPPKNLSKYDDSILTPDVCESSFVKLADDFNFMKALKQYENTKLKSKLVIIKMMMVMSTM